MISKRLAAVWVAASVIISGTLLVVGGSIYLDNRINNNLRSSKIVDERVDAAFRGICEILNVSARPRPQPPKRDAPGVPGPQTPYGKELAKYNEEVAKIQAEGIAAIKAAQESYHCKEKQ